MSSSLLPYAHIHRLPVLKMGFRKNDPFKGMKRAFMCKASFAFVQLGILLCNKDLWVKYR